MVGIIFGLLVSLLAISPLSARANTLEPPLYDLLLRPPPDDVRLTIRQYPSICWIFSKNPPASSTIRFSLIDSRQIKPLIEVQLPSPNTFEKDETCRCVNLKDYDIKLAPYVQYRWFISIIQNPESRSEDVVAGSVIERCEFEECRTVLFEDGACSEEQVVSLAKNGFWYDAVSCLCDLIRCNADDKKLRRLLAPMLKMAP